MFHQKFIFILCDAILFKIIFQCKNLITRPSYKNHRTLCTSGRKNTFKTNFIVSKFYRSFYNWIFRIYCKSHYSCTCINNSCSCCLIKKDSGIVLIHTYTFYNQLPSMTNSNISYISVINVWNNKLHIIFKISEPFILFYSFVKII